MLRWTALDLAEASRVGVATIRRAEVVNGEISVTSPNEAAIRAALEAAGIQFIDDGKGGVGVLLRKSRAGSRKAVSNA